MSSMPLPEQQRPDGPLEVAKLRALAEFAAGAGHEINNPVATIVGYVQQLLAGENDPDRRHALVTIGAQAYRIRDMIGDAMLFARPPKPEPVSLDLAEVCRDVVARLLDDSRRLRATIEVDAARQVPVLADPVQLRIVISAILKNSFEAIGQGGRVVVAASSGEGGRPAAVLTISDNGSGISPLEREHLFDPFYSGRQAGRGLGFGLAKAWRIVDAHGGRIQVDSSESGGARFVVNWPAPADSTV